MNLNIWLDIPSKYIGYFCVIVSDAADIFSEGLTDTSSQIFFPSVFWHFFSYS